MTNLIKVNPNEFGIEESKAAEMTSGLNQILAERAILSDQYAEVITLELSPENLETFKILRLKIRDNRTKGIETWHKVNKEFYLRGGQFVDAIKRKEVAENERMEDALLQCEKHFENLEKQRIADLQAKREGQLLAYEVENLQTLQLGTMSDDVFEAFLEASKNKYEAKKEAERVEAERIKAEKEAEAARIEAQRIENERLKAEASERERLAEIERKENERLLAIEREKAEKARKKAEEAARIEREKQQAILAAEKAERERLEAEIRAKEAAELKAKQEKEAAELKAKKEAEKLAKAPIKKQLNIWVESFALPETLIENETANDIKAKFAAFKEWSTKQVELI